MVAAERHSVLGSGYGGCSRWSRSLRPLILPAPLCQLDWSIIDHRRRNCRRLWRFNGCGLPVRRVGLRPYRPLQRTGNHCSVQLPQHVGDMACKRVTTTSFTLCHRRGLRQRALLRCATYCNGPACAWICCGVDQPEDFVLDFWLFVRAPLADILLEATGAAESSSIGPYRAAIFYSAAVGVLATFLIVFSRMRLDTKLIKKL